MKINVIVSGLDPAAMLPRYGGHIRGLCVDKA